MRCATGTPATGAHINAHTNAHINAHIIFPRTSVPSEMARTPFCQLRTSFCEDAQVICPEAQVILMRALAWPSRTSLPAVAGAQTDFDY
jgi:hypothetical protein